MQAFFKRFNMPSTNILREQLVCDYFVTFYDYAKKINPYANNHSNFKRMLLKDIGLEKS